MAAYGAGVDDPVAVFIHLPHLTVTVPAVDVIGASRWSEALGACVQWTRTTIFNPAPRISPPVTVGSLAQDVLRAAPGVAATLLWPSYRFATAKDECVERDGLRQTFELEGVAPSAEVFKSAAASWTKLRSRRSRGLKLHGASAYARRGWGVIEADRYAAPLVVSRLTDRWAFTVYRSDLPPPSEKYRAVVGPSRIDVNQTVHLEHWITLQKETPDTGPGVR